MVRLGSLRASLEYQILVPSCDTSQEACKPSSLRQFFRWRVGWNLSEGRLQSIRIEDLEDLDIATVLDRFVEVRDVDRAITGINVASVLKDVLKPIDRYAAASRRDQPHSDQMREQRVS